MDYKITIDAFEGPMDLLLHLIKSSDIDIYEIELEQITQQYLDYIEAMEEMNLNIASEYLIMAAELIEMKSAMLLPKKKIEADEYEEDPKEQLIKRLLEYKRYKEVTSELKKLEYSRKQYLTKLPENLALYKEESELLNFGDVNLDDLIIAFQKFMDRKKGEQPVHTKITKKEYSVYVRSNEIRSLLKNKKKIDFEDLFEVITKDYVVVTFLSILDLAKKQELEIKQENNFSKIVLSLRSD